MSNISLIRCSFLFVRILMYVFYLLTDLRACLVFPCTLSWKLIYCSPWHKKKKLLKKLVYHCKRVSGFGAYLNLNFIDHVEVFVNRRILNKVKTKT